MQATPVSLRTPTFASALRPHRSNIDRALLNGWLTGLCGDPCSPEVATAITTCRINHGFNDVVANLLTPPGAQHKLDMAAIKSYGMTLAHAVLSGHEMCPWRTPGCTATCVVSNGNGRYDTVQRAWMWRTELWTEWPEQAAWRLGWELARAVAKHGQILFRPDVNSDATWHRVLPGLAHLPGVTTYGYTKNPAVLSEGFSAPGFVHSYSWNERSKMSRVQTYLDRGGKLAVVTNRRKHADVDAEAVRAFFGADCSVAVADADATDEWMLADGPVIGDLTAKGRARQLIGVSAFVVVAY